MVKLHLSLKVKFPFGIFPLFINNSLRLGWVTWISWMSLNKTSIGFQSLFSFKVSPIQFFLDWTLLLHLGLIQSIFQLPRSFDHFPLFIWVSLVLISCLSLYLAISYQRKLLKNYTQLHLITRNVTKLTRTQLHFDIYNTYTHIKVHILGNSKQSTHSESVIWSLTLLY